MTLIGGRNRTQSSPPPPPAEPEIHIAPRKHHLDQLADYRRGVMADIQKRHIIPPTFQQISPMTDSDYDNQADNQKQHVAPDIHQTQPITVPDHPQQTITPDIQIPSMKAPDHQVSYLTELIQALQLPKTELIQFNGDPLQYWPFIRAFDNIVERGTNDSAARLARLVQYCTGKARRVIECTSIMKPDDGYAKARQLLSQRFGHDFIIAQAWIKKVTDRPQIRPNDREGMQDYADTLQNCKETLRHGQDK